MRLLMLALLSLAAPAWLQAQARPNADALARALQTRYQGVKDFSAEFTQTYRGGVLRTQTREQGTVLIKKPGRMRWVYTRPERKEFVADGVKLYSYLPADKRVMVSNVPEESQATSPAMFLAGKGDVSRDFSASFVENPPAGTVGLKLVPRKPEPDYEHFVLILDPGSLQIQALTTRDHQGGESTLAFTKLKENQGISDKEFTFRIPRGVDVVTDDSRN
jgi:outer membrane lipoprotein carrier protein